MNVGTNGTSPPIVKGERIVNKILFLFIFVCAELAVSNFCAFVPLYNCVFFFRLLIPMF